MNGRKKIKKKLKIIMK